MCRTGMIRVDFISGVLTSDFLQNEAHPVHPEAQCFVSSERLADVAHASLQEFFEPFQS